MSDQRSYVHRRRVPRRAFIRKVGILVRGKYSIAQALEIGEGGMMLMTDKMMVEGQKTVLAFQIPGRIDLVLTGTVRYIIAVDERYLNRRYGIQFDNIDFEGKRHIRGYVASKPEGEKLQAI